MSSNFNLGSIVRTASSLMYGVKEPLQTNIITVIPPADVLMTRKIEIHKLHLRGYGYPLILMPLTTKLYDKFKDLENKLLVKGGDLISEADEIFVIGYRAADKAIEDMLKKAKKNVEIHVIGRNLEEVEKIMSRVISFRSDFRKGLTSGRGFTEFAELFRTWKG